MYVGFKVDRRALGFKTLKDENSIHQLDGLFEKLISLLRLENSTSINFYSAKNYRYVLTKLESGKIIVKKYIKNGKIWILSIVYIVVFAINSILGSPEIVIEMPTNSDFQTTLVNDSSISSGKELKQASETLQSTLEIRNGDLSPKSGPGARAKADARKTIPKSFSRNQGVSGYTPQHVYRKYHESGNSNSFLDLSPKPIESQLEDSFKAKPTPKFSKSGSGKEIAPITVKPTAQQKDVIITNRDIKKFLTSEEYQRYPDAPEFVQQLKQTEVGNRIRLPQKVYKKEYRNEDVTVYVGTTGKNGDRAIAIVSDKSGRIRLDTKITDLEYNQLQNSKNKELNLFDLKRDPDTGVMSDKAIREANALERAIENGIYPANEYRRPCVYAGERAYDFVSQDYSTKLEIRSVVHNRHKSFDNSANDISKKILQNHQANSNNIGFEHPNYGIDLIDVPQFLQHRMQKKIEINLAEIIDQLTIDFIY